MYQWKHTFNWPKLPFNTWDEKKLLYLDGFGLWICLFSLVALFFMVYKKLRFSKEEKPVYPNKPLYFSLVYFAMLFFYLVFFSEIAGNNTAIYSANRYVMAVPFFSILFYYMLTNKDNMGGRLFLGIVSLVIVIVNCKHPLDGYGAHKTLLYYSYFAGYALIYLLMQFENIAEKYWLVLYGVNCFLQLYLLNMFLNSGWVG